MIIAISNQKGGVGKTTTAVTLAHGLALKGKQVLLVDLDPQGHSAIALGLSAEPGIFQWLVAERPIVEALRKARENLHVLPGDIQTSYAQLLIGAQQRGIDYLQQKLKPLMRNGLDYILMDTSPSVGGMQERALFAANLVIVPTAVDYLSADAVASTMNTMQRNVEHGWNGKALVLPTFYDAVTTESQQTLADLRETYGEIVLQPIHRATLLRECAAEGVTIWERDGDSRAGKEYARVLYALLEVTR